MAWLVIVANSKSWELHVHQPPKKKQHGKMMFNCMPPTLMRPEIAVITEAHLFRGRVTIHLHIHTPNMSAQAKLTPQCPHWNTARPQNLQSVSKKRLLNVFCRAWLGFMVAGSDISNLPWNPVTTCLYQIIIISLPPCSISHTSLALRHILAEKPMKGVNIDRFFTATAANQMNPNCQKQLIQPSNCLWPRLKDLFIPN